MNKALITALPVAFALAACTSGGDGGDPANLPQNSSPSITDPGPISVEENSRNVIDLVVTDADGNPVTLSLSGTDAGRFTISNSGTLAFAIPADFEAPGDADGNNVYEVTVTASDTYSTDTSVNLEITVTDVVVGDGIPQTSNLVTTDATTFVQENIISSFEYPVLMQSETNKFTLSGVFADPAIAQSGWNNLDGPSAARIGDAAVTTCEITGVPGDCDAPQGEILILDFTVTQDSITFLMSGGDGGALVGVELILASDGSVLSTYNPNFCGDAVIRGDQHYVHWDTSGLIGTDVRIRIFDENSGGCGFISFDHFYQTNSPMGVNIGSPSKPLPPVNVTSEAAAVTGLIPHASFENPEDMVNNRGWVATGAFANPMPDSWEGTARASNAAAARFGDRAVSTCEMNANSAGCDAPVGTVTSPSFQVTDTYLNFLMAGGNGAAPVGMNLLDGAGNVIHTYTPNSCGPSHIDGDNDWVWVDISALSTAYVRMQVFDNEPGGCGFVSFDHFYQGPNAWNPGGGTDGGAVALTPAVEANLGFNVSLPDDAFDQVIGSFDDATTNNWTATGDFMNPAGPDAWQGVSGEGRVGLRAVSTCELNNNAAGCDAPTGSLTSPEFMVDAARPYFNILITGGNGGTVPVGFEVLDPSDSVIASFQPASCGPPWVNGDDDWVSVDLTAQIGNMVKIRIYDNEAGGCGFVSFDHPHMSATAK